MGENPRESLSELAKHWDAVRTETGRRDSAVNAIAGLPSPSGSNDLVLVNASSKLGLEPGVSRQQFAHDWHLGFG